jgi:hypothetical protein
MPSEREGSDFSLGRNDNPFFFAAFASLRENLRDFVAALARWDSLARIFCGIKS